MRGLGADEKMMLLACDAHVCMCFVLREELCSDCFEGVTVILRNIHEQCYVRK